VVSDRLNGSAAGVPALPDNESGALVSRTEAPRTPEQTVEAFVRTYNEPDMAANHAPIDLTPFLAILTDFHWET
jgi:hypothetical protein